MLCKNKLNKEKVMNKQKKVFISLLVMLLLIGCVFADSTVTSISLIDGFTQETKMFQIVKLEMDGEPVLTDVPPILYEMDGAGRTLVPIRFISENVGAKVGWDQATKTVTLDLNDKQISLQINNHIAVVNGKEINLPDNVPAKLMGNNEQYRTMVPVRFVSEHLGLEVGWEGSTSTVTISSENEQILSGEVSLIEEKTIEQVLYWNLGADPRTLDPSLNETTNGSNVINNMFEGLMREKNGKIEYGMAESYVVSSDLLTYTFKIRKDAKWSDGSDLTAKDFEYAWNRVLDPSTGSPYAWIYDEANVASVVAPDERTFVVTLSSPADYFLSLTGFTTFFPVKQSSVEAGLEGNWAKDPVQAVSNGPFKLASYTIGDSLVLVKNEYYWNADSVKLDKIVGKFIIESNEAFTAFESDEIQINSKIPQSQIRTLLAEKSIIYANSRPGTYYLNLNMNNPAFDDPRVRKALSYAIDRKVITDMLGNGERPANNMVPLGILDSEGNDFNKKANGFGIPTDGSKIEEAKVLMAEAGYPNGEGFPVIEYLTNYSEAHILIAQSIKEMWKDNLGVEMTISYSEWSEFSKTRSMHKFMVARGGWIGDYTDPLTFIGYFVTGNSLNDPLYSSTEFDTLINESKYLTGQKRMNKLYKANELLLNDGPVIPLYHYADNIMIASKVNDFDTTFLGAYYFGDVYLD